MPSRGTNIRVVQDLERQLRDTKNDLYDARTTIDLLRSQPHIAMTTGQNSIDDGHPDLYVTSSDSRKAQLSLSWPDGSPSSPLRSLNPFHDYTPLRQQILRLGDGIFKAPPGHAIFTKAAERKEAKLKNLTNPDTPT